jgi:hypothetical protein
LYLEAGLGHVLRHDMKVVEVQGPHFGDRVCQDENPLLHVKACLQSKKEAQGWCFEANEHCHILAGKDRVW